MTKRRDVLKALGASTVATTSGCTTLLENAEAAEQYTNLDSEENYQQDLAKARQATAEYHNTDKALEDGYQPMEGCVETPAGGMGVHYINQQLLDEELDVENPEALMYEPTENGENLVGVEYIRPGPEQEEAPEFLGEEMHYNNHVGAYTLHAWIWKNNPEGTFAEFNPKVSCPDDSGGH